MSKKILPFVAAVVTQQISEVFTKPLQDFHHLFTSLHSFVEDDTEKGKNNVSCFFLSAYKPPLWCSILLANAGINRAGSNLSNDNNSARIDMLGLDTKLDKIFGEHSIGRQWSVQEQIWFGFYREREKMLASTVDKSLEDLNEFLKKLDTSLGKNSKFSKLIQEINNASTTIKSESEDALITQTLVSLDNQLDSVFGVDRKYILESNGEFKFNFDETLSTAFGKGLPSIQGNLYLDWSLTNSSQVSAGFKKVQLDLGSYFDDLI